MKLLFENELTRRDLTIMLYSAFLVSCVSARDTGDSGDSYESGSYGSGSCGSGSCGSGSCGSGSYGSGSHK